MIITKMTFAVLVCLINMIGLAIVYFPKKKIQNEENKIYSIILVANIIGLILHLLSDFVSYCYSTLPHFFSDTILKIYLIYYLFFGIMLLKYVTTITNIRFKKIVSVIVYLLLFIGSVIIVILPQNINIDISNMIFYTNGKDVKFLYAISGVVSFLILCFIILNINRVSKLKIIPLIIFMFGGLVAMSVQNRTPDFVITDCVESIICLLMYFTIENPDVRLVEYEKREKELAISANEAKTAFLSSMSHELRTPLNAIVGLSEDIQSYKDRVPDEVKEDSDDIVNASNTLLEIIGNILDISKIEGGKLELIESDYLPKEEIESLLKIMRTKIEEKSLEFETYIDPNIPECLYGDRLRIKQIINNFLSNAIKYTENGSIKFGVRWINNCLEIKVSDTGRGIKETDMGKLFGKFERLNVEKTSSVQGTGLGLSITKNLVELMGGNISVNSVYGKGSSFSVIIPQKLGNKENIIREALSVEEKQEANLAGKKVLVVDDNKLNIKVLRKAISSYNFDIDECYDGKTAIDKINAGNYDLVFMDIMMPIMGGEEAIKILKSNPEFKIPVIALTADAINGAKERYLACGFVDYLAKPFSRDVIAAKIETYLK